MTRPATPDQVYRGGLWILGKKKRNQTPGETLDEDPASRRRGGGRRNWRKKTRLELLRRVRRILEQRAMAARVGRLSRDVACSPSLETSARSAGDGNAASPSRAGAALGGGA